MSNPRLDAFVAEITRHEHPHSPEAFAAGLEAADAVGWRPIEEALRELPPGPWEVWSSCSFRRITGPDGRDGGVLCGIVQLADGHPDNSMSEDQLRALCAVVNGVRAALATLHPTPGPSQ